MTDTMYKLTGKAPMNMRDLVKLHGAELEEKDDVHLSKNARGRGAPFAAAVSGDTGERYRSARKR
jgi:hypothetical protein